MEKTIEEEDRAEILNELLGSQAECLRKIALNPDKYRLFRYVSETGYESMVIIGLHNGDNRFDENTLTMDRNIELLKALFDYKLRRGYKINEESITSFANRLSSIKAPELSFEIREQLMQIAKPFMKY